MISAMGVAAESDQSADVQWVAGWLKALRFLARPSVLVLATALLSSCSPGDPRVIVLNDSNQAERLFYCLNDGCTRGISGNDTLVEPGKSVNDYWNSPDSSGLLGVATSPENLLLGCLENPTEGQDSPPTTTVRTSRLRACPGQRPGQKLQIRIVNP
jgi:hypothetical protein